MDAVTRRPATFSFPAPPSSARGFTLIEILVVCAIIAVTLGLAMARFDPSDASRLGQAAEDLARRLEAARDDAVMRGQTIAFSSDGQGYQFWVQEDGRDGWVALPDSDTIASARLAGGVVLGEMRVNGLPRPLGERLAFSFSGLSEAFTLTLASGPARLEIVGDALGRVEIRRAQ